MNNPFFTSSNLQRVQIKLLLPLACILIPFLIGPALFGFLASFTNYAPTQAHIRFVGLANFAAILHDSQATAAVRNITLFVACAVPLELAVGFGLAYLLRHPFRGRDFIRIVMLIPWLVGPIANGVMWRFLLSNTTGFLSFAQTGLGLPEAASPLGVPGLALLTLIATEVWRKSPLVAFLLLPGLLAIPAEQWEQAVLDGAALHQRVFNIAWPGLRSLVWVVGLLLAGETLGTFEGVLVMTGGGPGTATLTPGLLSFQQAFQVNDWSRGAASAWLIMVAVMWLGLVYAWLARKDELL